jgi:hypothetical protein
MSIATMTARSPTIAFSVSATHQVVPAYFTPISMTASTPVSWMISWKIQRSRTFFQHGIPRYVVCEVTMWSWWR